jgi:hypothetical protein
MCFPVQPCLTKCANTQSVLGQEAQLSAFVRWILTETCTNQHSPGEALKLLDQAWEAQKLLWRLRQQQPESSETTLFKDALSIEGISMDTESKTRYCPYCKGEIEADATKCKYCGSSVTPKTASYKGTCPYCKEQVHPEAIKCKHCGSDLRSGLLLECGCKQQITIPQFATNLAYNLSQASLVSFGAEAMNTQLSAIARRVPIIIVGPGGPCELRLVPCTVCNQFGCGRALCEVIVCAPPVPIFT